MTWTVALLFLLGTLCLGLLSGLPVAFSFLLINILGSWVFLGGEVGIIQGTRNSMQSLVSYSLVPIPLFVLMGEIMLHTGLAYRAIGAIDRMISKLPGRMPVVSVVAGSVFAALSGSSMANTAMLGNTLLPEMIKRGYDARLPMGAIMAVGGIAILIPPSALAVLLGSLAGISISALLIAGIIPGILMAFLFVGYIVVRSTINPELTPQNEEVELVKGWARYKPFFRDVLPLFLILFVVIGSMLSGIAAPTDASALGVTATIIAALAYRKLTVEALITSMIATAKISGMILLIVASSLTFSQILAFSGAATGLLQWVQGMELSPAMILVAMVLILLLLGCFVDQVSMVMMTVPFFIPISVAADIDLVWLGVLYLLTMEISLLTPPFGMLLFVMKSVAPKGIGIGEVIRAGFPFLVLEMLVLVLVMIFPAIALWLPNVLLN